MRRSNLKNRIHISEEDKREDCVDVLQAPDTLIDIHNL